MSKSRMFADRKIVSKARQIEIARRSKERARNALTLGDHPEATRYFRQAGWLQHCFVTESEL